jgi:hypothetical protein
MEAKERHIKIIGINFFLKSFSVLKKLLRPKISTKLKNNTQHKGNNALALNKTAVVANKSAK